jgi:2-dehydropantoate 2-reductase
MPQVDVVLVGLKSTNEHLLRTLLPPLLHRDTLVVLIQNGIGLEADVQTWFPDLALAAGLAFFAMPRLEMLEQELLFIDARNTRDHS